MNWTVGSACAAACAPALVVPILTMSALPEIPFDFVRTLIGLNAFKNAGKAMIPLEV